MKELDEFNSLQFDKMVVINMRLPQLPGGKQLFTTSGIYQRMGINPEGERMESTGFVFGCRDVSIKNILTWWNCEDTNLMISIDYVHNICSNGWSFGSLGTTFFRDDIHVVHSFLPFLYSFSRTESSVAYEAMFGQLILIIVESCPGTTYDSVRKRISFAQGDDAKCIKKAVATIFPDTTYYGCYAHFMRNVSKKSHLLGGDLPGAYVSRNDQMIQDIIPRFRQLGSVGGLTLTLTLTLTLSLTLLRRWGGTLEV